MGFRNDAYARIWEVEEKGNYSVGKISISRKDKDTGKYNVEFQDGFVRFVGQAHKALQGVQIDSAKGISVKISSCDVSSIYKGKDGKTSYYPHYTVFGIELQDENVKQTPIKDTSSLVAIPDDVEGDALPFN